MHVITRSRRQEFWRRYSDAERPLRAWLAMMRLKRYSEPHEVRQDFASAIAFKKKIFRVAALKPPWLTRLHRKIFFLKSIACSAIGELYSMSVGINRPRSSICAKI